MKYLKIYEDIESIKEIEHKQKLEKNDFNELTNKYKNHFFLYNDSIVKKEYFFIVLVHKIEPHNSPYPINNYYQPVGDYFEVYKNGKIKDPGGGERIFINSIGGWSRSITEEEFNNIHFMTATELYNEHKELCVNLFIKIINDLKNDNYAVWYIKILKRYKEVLESIPELEYIKNAEIYNL